MEQQPPSVPPYRLPDAHPEIEPDPLARVAILTSIGMQPNLATSCLIPKSPDLAAARTHGSKIDRIRQGEPRCYRPGGSWALGGTTRPDKLPRYYCVPTRVYLRRWHSYLCIMTGGWAAVRGSRACGNPSRPAVSSSILRSMQLRSAARRHCPRPEPGAETPPPGGLLA